MERQKYEKKLAEKRANREGGTEEASHVGETGNRTMRRERVERKKKKKMKKKKKRKERERERERGNDCGSNDNTHDHAERSLLSFPSGYFWPDC